MDYGLIIVESKRQPFSTSVTKELSGSFVSDYSDPHARKRKTLRSFVIERIRSFRLFLEVSFDSSDACEDLQNKLRLSFTRKNILNKYFASSNPHPPHSRAYDRYSKFLRILETSTPNSYQPFWTVSATRLASCSGGILVGSTGEYWRAAPARSHRQGILSGKLGGIHWRATARYSAGHSAGSTGGLLWWDTRRDPLHWRATLGYSVGYLAGSISGLLWWDTRRDPLWRDTRRDLPASRSGGILGGIHWRAALAGYWARSTGQLLWRDTRRDPLARDAWRDPLALASRSGGILGGIHWRAALAGCSAGSTGEQLWRNTGRDPLASSSGGILGGIHWRTALAGYWVGAWCRSIANADSNIKSINPFLSGGEKRKNIQRTHKNNEPLQMCDFPLVSLCNPYAQRKHE